MSNELSRAIKRKTDAQLRTMGEDRSSRVSESASGNTIILNPSQIQVAYSPGKNIDFDGADGAKIINAIMNIAPGTNIEVSEPDLETGEVTISATIGGKEIDLTGLMDGYVLKYDSVSDSFIVGEGGGGGLVEVPQATETTLGGVKAKARTTENAEVTIDGATGKLYAPESGGSYTLPQADATTLGGIKAKAKTSETMEVAIESATGKLFVPAPDEAANGIPAGGTSGQILSKVDGTDYSAQWVDNPSAFSVAVAGGYSGDEEDFETDLASIEGLAAAIAAIVGV